ncbi:sensor histidine kinase [Dyella mobilis]|uniref:Histidine kinase n=1 Tax=Dyella mobilis TaxID=1849582 RepID=A0ABS2KJC8_9GAMM|nr:histidine kinase [Dyella mobilis]MBM7131282.1 histidine kinase [Dyella mobilis]GLQ98781.1 hypothetical protein GCM10007863_32010 [Dyella mobilis]
MLSLELDKPAFMQRKSAWLMLWLGVLVLIGLLNALHRYLNNVSAGAPALFAVNLIEEMTGSLSFGLMMPVLILALRKIRNVQPLWLRLSCHVPVLIVLSVLHTSLMWGSRVVLFALGGLGTYRYGVTSWRYLMEFPSDVFYYLLVAAVLWLLDRYREAQQRELRAVQLESALSEARLDALRLQLNPHFLFNTLNAVSSIMYDQPRVADEMLARIGDLLRATLNAKKQEHPLGEEWRLLALYLDIQRARFGEQLVVDIEADPALDGYRVPFLVLQPLVENAIEHGGGATRHIDIQAARIAAQLEIRIRNDGAAVGENTHSGHGIGLGNVEARLQHLYGDAAGVQLERREGQGATVRVWLPLPGEQPA